MLNSYLFDKHLNCNWGEGERGQGGNLDDLFLKLTVSHYSSAIQFYSNFFEWTRIKINQWTRILFMFVKSIIFNTINWFLFNLNLNFVNFVFIIFGISIIPLKYKSNIVVQFVCNSIARNIYCSTVVVAVVAVSSVLFNNK